MCRLCPSLAVDKALNMEDAAGRINWTHEWMISKFDAPYMLLLHMAAQKLDAMINSSCKSDSGCGWKTFQIEILFSELWIFGSLVQSCMWIWGTKLYF